MKKLESLALKVEWDLQNKKLFIHLLDQTLLPHAETWLEIQSLDQMIEAIKSLRVRGAPLIGVSAALMLAKLILEKKESDSEAGSYSDFQADEYLNWAQKLYEARPTAVNLMICIDRMKKAIQQKNSPQQLVELAFEIFEEDVRLCEQIALNGADCIVDGDQILTHCNTGGLATAGAGTALAVIAKAHQQGKKIHVYIDETRPLLQGGRLTAWELQKLKIPCTLITDNMAAHLMSLKKINKAIVGSDRIAQNGDFANKIGTYSVAVNCFYHQIPFYVAAPYTTVDKLCPSGQFIPIEQRASAEVISTWAPKDIQVYNPAFDVTPAELVTGWILDKAIYYKEDILKGVFKK